MLRSFFLRKIDYTIILLLSLNRSKTFSFLLFKSIPAHARKSAEMRGKSLLVEIATRKGIESRW